MEDGNSKVESNPIAWLIAIGRFYDNSVSDNPAVQAGALAQLQAWRQWFEEATGYELTEEIEQLPGKLKEAADSDHKANLRHSAKAINEFVEMLQKAENEKEA